MKIALAAVGFYERDIEYNRNKILKCLKENSGKAELILFGETFLQGFEALDWKYETDQHMALSVSDSNIQMIRKAAEENALAVSFGFLEKAENKGCQKAGGNLLRMNITQKEICLQNLNIWEKHFQLVFAAICGMRKMSCR